MVIIFIGLSETSAQYNKGDITANMGLSLGVIGYGYGYYSGASGFIPVVANAEYSINDIFAVGPYAGFYSRSYGNGDFKFTSVSFGGRGTFHASNFLNDKLSWKINSEKLDLYGTLHIGVETTSWKYRNDILSKYYSNATSFIFGPVVGARYMFTPQFGGFIELGRGAFGWMTFGVSGKF